MQKCVYGLADASRFWYLKFKEELIKLGALPLTLDKGIFIWAKEHKVIGIVACFVVDVLLGGNEEFSRIIKQLKSTFQIGAKHKEIFDYLEVHLQQNNDSSIILVQNQYINTINLIPISPEQSRQRHHPLSKEETTLLRSKIITATISDITSVNKVIKFIKNTPNHIKIPSLELGSLEIHLYTDASFNNLPDGGSSRWTHSLHM